MKKLLGSLAIGFVLISNPWPPGHPTKGMAAAAVRLCKGHGHGHIKIMNNNAVVMVVCPDGYTAEITKEDAEAVGT